MPKRSQRVQHEKLHTRKPCVASSGNSNAVLLSCFRCSSAAAASLSPAALLPQSSCLSLVLSSSAPLILLLMRSPHVVLLCFWRCPVTICPSFVLLVCFPSFILLSSSYPPLVFLLSFCCRAVCVAFRGRGSGCDRPPPQQPFLPTRQFGVCFFVRA